MKFEKLEIKLGKKLNRDEWTQHIEGGWIQNTVKHKNLRALHTSIIYDNANVKNVATHDNSQIYGNVVIKGINKDKDKYTIWIYDKVKIYDNAKLNGYMSISNNVRIYNDSELSGVVHIHDNVKIYENCKIKFCSKNKQDNLVIYDNIKIHGDVVITLDKLKKYGLKSYNDGSEYILYGNHDIYDEQSLKNAVEKIIKNEEQKILCPCCNHRFILKDKK